MFPHQAFQGPRAWAVLAAVLLAGPAVGQQPGQGGWSGSNAILVASRHLIHAALARPTERTLPIEESFEKTQVTGMSYSHGNVGVELLPCDDRAALNVVVLGVITTKTTGRNGPVTLYNQGTIPFEARKPWFIDEGGITWLPTKTCARARDELLCVETSIKHKNVDQLVQTFAKRSYYDTKPKVEERQARKAEEKVNEASDEDIEAELARTNQSLQDRLNQMRQSGVVIRDLNYRTTPLALRAALIIEDGLPPDQKTAPPEAPWPVDLSVRLHQGAANTVLQKRYAGKSYKRDELMQEIRGYLGSNNRPKDAPQQAWVGLKFDAKEPVTVEFANKGITVKIKTESFDAGNDEYEEITITVRYRIEQTATGPKMIRDGDIKVIGPGGFNQAAAAIIKKRLQPDLPEELPLRPITPPEGLRRVGQLRTTFVNADLGWVVMGWER